MTFLFFNSSSNLEVSNVTELKEMCVAYSPALRYTIFGKSRKIATPCVSSRVPAMMKSVYCREKD